MRSKRRMRPDGVVCFALSGLSWCGENTGGGSAAAESLEAWVGSASGTSGGALVDGLETSAVRYGNGGCTRWKAS